jgi:hypothetical protein
LVSPQKAQIVHFEKSEQDTNDWPVVMLSNHQYLLAFEDGRVAIRATHEDDAVFDYRAKAGGLHEVIDKALTLAPRLANCIHLEMKRTVTGTVLLKYTLYIFSYSYLDDEKLRFPDFDITLTLVRAEPITP